VNRILPFTFNMVMLSLLNGCIEFPAFSVPIDMQVQQNDMTIVDMKIIDQKIVDMATIDQQVVLDLAIDMAVDMAPMIDMQIIEDAQIVDMQIIDMMLPVDICNPTLNPNCPCTETSCPQTDWIHINAGDTRLRYHEPPVEVVLYDSSIPYDFWMTKTEITVTQFQQCLDANSSYCLVCDLNLPVEQRPKHCINVNGEKIGTTNDLNFPNGLVAGTRPKTIDLSKINSTHTINKDEPTNGFKPITGLNWFQANQFCKWIGGSLPSESEWQLAALGAKQDGFIRRYPWIGNQIDCNYTNLRGIITLSTTETCRLPNALSDICSLTSGNTPEGLCDMLGNAEEWVLDDKIFTQIQQTATQGNPNCLTNVDCSSTEVVMFDTAKIVKGFGFNSEINFTYPNNDRQNVVMDSATVSYRADTSLNSLGFRCVFRR
jgi:formylglycine-generating enzyme required for sulfatase activity